MPTKYVILHRLFIKKVKMKFPKTFYFDNKLRKAAETCMTENLSEEVRYNAVSSEF